MKQFRKCLMVFGFLAIGCLHGYAQEKVPSIVVELSNGQKVEYSLDDNPKLLYDGNKITLTTDKVEIEYLPSELAKVTNEEVENVSNGIKDLQKEAGQIKLDGSFIRLCGFPAGENVRVCNLGGTLLSNHHVSIDGSLVIPLSSLPKGISLIKTNKQSIKITKR